MTVTAIAKTPAQLRAMVSPDASGVTYAPYLANTSSTAFDWEGQFISSTTTTTTVDSYGNPVRVRTETNAHRVTEIANEYVNDSSRWLLGRLTASRTTSAVPNQQVQWRSSSFEYDSNTGLLSKEVSTAPLLPSVTKTYERDGFGNIIRSTLSSADISDRITDPSSYDTTGRFVVSLQDPGGITEARSYNPIWGTMISLTDNAGRTTRWSYDSMGREESTPSAFRRGR